MSPSLPYLPNDTPIEAQASMSYRSQLGFRDGDKGTHTSRTIMSAELRLLLDYVPTDANKETYKRAVVDDNILGKHTVATRKLSFQRLSELYGLDASIPLFRYMRFLWDVDIEARPLLSLLNAYARDPLLRMSAPAVLGAEPGTYINKNDIERTLIEVAGERFNPAILNKIARNAASSWTQSGHLLGRTRKQRAKLQVTPGAVALALFIGYLEGLRAQRLFDTPWTRLLEVPVHIQDFTLEASRRGWLDYLRVDTIVEVRFPGRLKPEEEEWTHESAQ
jgi:hypothetical protein